MGGINGDGKVDMRDIGYGTKRYGIDSSSPSWDVKSDLVPDGKIDMRDISVARHYGVHT